MTTFPHEPLINENEKLVAAELMEIDPTSKIIDIVGSVMAVLRGLTENADLDIIFADIQLGDGSSFVIFKKS